MFSFKEYFYMHTYIHVINRYSQKRELCFLWHQLLLEALFSFHHPAFRVYFLIAESTKTTFWTEMIVTKMDTFNF